MGCFGTVTRRPTEGDFNAELAETAEKVYIRLSAISAGSALGAHKVAKTESSR